MSSSTTPRRFSCTPSHPVLGSRADTDAIVVPNHSVLGSSTSTTGPEQHSGLATGTETDAKTSICSRFVLAFPCSANNLPLTGAPSRSYTQAPKKSERNGSTDDSKGGLKEGENEGFKGGLKDPLLVCPPGLDATVFFSMDIASQREVVLQYTQPRPASHWSLQGGDMETLPTTRHTTMTTTAAAVGTVQLSSSPQGGSNLCAGDIIFPIPFRIPPVPYDYDSVTDPPMTAAMTTVPWMGQRPDEVFDAVPFGGVPFGGVPFGGVPFGGAEGGGNCVVQ